MMHARPHRVGRGRCGPAPAQPQPPHTCHHRLRTVPPRHQAQESSGRIRSGIDFACFFAAADTCSLRGGEVILVLVLQGRGGEEKKRGRLQTGFEVVLDASGVMTPRQLFESLAKAGYGVRYLCAPPHPSPLCQSDTPLPICPAAGSSVFSQRTH